MFFSVRLLPGDYPDIILSDPNLGGGTQADKERLREMLGLAVPARLAYVLAGDSLPHQPATADAAPGPSSRAGWSGRSRWGCSGPSSSCYFEPTGVPVLDPSSIAAT